MTTNNIQNINAETVSETKAQQRGWNMEFHMDMQKKKKIFFRFVKPKTK